MRIRLAILLLCVMLCLCGCSMGAPKQLQFTTINGVEYIVNSELKTIQANDVVYPYVFEGDHITITYPNGATYWWTVTSTGGHGGWTGDYDAVTYADGDILVSLLLQETPAPKHGEGYYLAMAVLGIIGLLNLITPKVAWYVGYGWHFKNGEPSEASLTFNRIIGAGCLIGVIVMIML